MSDVLVLSLGWWQESARTRRTSQGEEDFSDQSVLSSPEENPQELSTTQQGERRAAGWLSGLSLFVQNLLDGRSL